MARADVPGQTQPPSIAPNDVGEASARLIWARWTEARWMAARARASREDVSPPCSGHDGLTPGLGDRNVVRQPAGAPKRARAAKDWWCSNDAPPNGNADSLAPRQARSLDSPSPGIRRRELSNARLIARSGRPLRPLQTPSRCARGPRRRDRQGRSLLVPRYYVKGVRMSLVRAGNMPSGDCRRVDTRGVTPARDDRPRRSR